MAGYCSEADLYTYGLPRGALPNPGQLVTADATTNAFTLGEHGFELDHVVSFRAEAGGSLPAPLAAGTDYYVVPVNHYLFKVAATAGGATIDLTTAGQYVVVISAPPIAGAIEFGARVIDQALVAHPVPLEAPYPEIIVITNAELAIGKLLNGAEGKSLAQMVEAAMKRVATWAKGVPLRAGPATPDAANVATSAPAPTTAGGPSGWSRFGGIS